MKRKPTQELMGVVDCGWDLRLLLPIDMAHQLQKITAHAVQIDCNYESGDRKYYYTKTFTPPPVNIQYESMLTFDATMLTADEVKEWKKEVNASLSDNPNAKAKDILSPQSWLAMRGEV